MPNLVKKLEMKVGLFKFLPSQLEVNNIPLKIGLKYIMKTEDYHISNDSHVDVSLALNRWEGTYCSFILD